MRINEAEQSDGIPTITDKRENNLKNCMLLSMYRKHKGAHHS